MELQPSISVSFWHPQMYPPTHLPTQTYIWLTFRTIVKKNPHSLYN
jgi:hypothetical protein